MSPDVVSVAELCRAIVLLVGRGQNPNPALDPSRVIAEFGASEGPRLARTAMAIVDEAFAVPIDWAAHTLQSATEKVGTQLRARHPELSDEAISAILWEYSYSNR